METNRMKEIQINFGFLSSQKGNSRYFLGRKYDNFGLSFNKKKITQKALSWGCLIQRGVNPNETLPHSNGIFVFDHGPKVKLEVSLILKLHLEASPQSIEI